MNQIKMLAALAVISASMAGCSVQTVTPKTTAIVTKPKPIQPADPWQARQRVMSNMRSWDMNGRAALRFRGDAWTFGLGWMQKNRQEYTLQIRNPVTGTIVALLEQRPGKAVMRSQGKVHTGVDAERLLEQQMRVKMPVNGMPYWIRGVMAPQYPAGKVALDGKGRPTQIIQSGWVIDYLGYQGSDFAAMPSKVNISRAQNQVKVRVLTKRWRTH
ncbi:MAG: outer membrane lipoprotein LolB [Proteobacteria bacterium]|nr:MAG: outer membrane lipoprotein LolB [Pseudomonadota bacterium]